MNIKVDNYINNNFEELQQISRRITQGHELSDDLLQEVILQIYEKQELLLREYDDDNIKYYIIACLKLNWRSKTSPFYYKIRKEPKEKYTELKSGYVNYKTTEEDEELEVYEDLVIMVEEEFCDLTWFSKRLLELYLTLGSLKKVSVQTTIPIASVGRYIREIKQEIRINVERRIKDT